MNRILQDEFAKTDYVYDHKYDQECAAQQEKQKELALADEPMRLKPIEAARKALSMTPAEEELVGRLTMHTVLFLMMSMMSRDDASSKKSSEAMTIKYERELLELHRSLVAKAVSAARLPASGNL